MQTIFDQLAAPFDPDRVSWRVGSTNGDKSKGMALAYIDARDVMVRLDLVMGPQNWERRHPHVGGTTTCEIALWIEGRGWVVKSDGAGDTDVEAEKGSLSDSFKRAAVNWGVGRYLYDLPAPWVALTPAGRSYKIKDDEYGKLRGLLASHSGFTLKSHAQAKRDRDFEFFTKRVDEAENLEALEAIGREIKTEIGLLPTAMRDPLRNHYAQRKEELESEARAAKANAEMDDDFRRQSTS